VAQTTLASFGAAVPEHASDDVVPGVLGRNAIKTLGQLRESPGWHARKQMVLDVEKHAVADSITQVTAHRSSDSVIISAAAVNGPDCKERGEALTHHRCARKTARRRLAVVLTHMQPPLAKPFAAQLNF